MWSNTRNRKYANKYGANVDKKSKSPGDKSPRVAIPFNLVQCPANAQVTFTFVGTQNAVDKQLLALSNANATTTAKHAAIEMTDRDRNRIPISIAGGQSNKSQPLLADANGNLSVIFYANYIATDASATAGSANANAVFLISINRYERLISCIYIISRNP